MISDILSFKDGTEGNSTIMYLKDVSTMLAMLFSVREGNLCRHIEAEREMPHLPLHSIIKIMPVTVVTSMFFSRICAQRKNKLFNTCQYGVLVQASPRKALHLFTET